MKSRVLPALIGLLTVVALVPSAHAAAAPQDKPVFWIDMYGQPSRHPERVFFTANSGGYMEDIEWTDWGARKTVAHGTFGTTAPCDPDGDGPETGGPPCPDGPAKMVLRKPVRCTPEFGPKEGKKVRVYRKATLWYPDGEGGIIRANISDRAGWATCKEAQ